MRANDMNLINLTALLLWLVGGQVAGVVAGSMILMDPELPLKKCRYIRSYDLLQAQCKDLKLNDVPNNLQTGIEVLDARENRIRELRNDTLSRYMSLRYLYLQDNFVQTIAEHAFGPTYYLEVLDLSKNGLLELPKSLYQLQSLRNLYLSDNQLTDAVFDVSGIRSPLQWLYLANNKLTRLPKLSPLTTLTLLNVSHNSINHITTEDIASLCSLQIFDITGNPIRFDQNNCECYELREWISFRGIKLKLPLDCPPAVRERCSIVEFSNRTMSLYSTCLANVRNRVEARKARSTWIWIASCIGVFISCIFVALCCMHKRNRNKRQRLKEQEVLASNNANTEQLLNKDVSHEQS
ncbi:PREDICTED: amphoterin-induced protein 3 [Ceratosolen solmsi marchali]|uniref:Amphoterin-induced protein 3 n=1 Tax=Ceratosolen solmsi marchali TaxID=326594 RepID=A0AAJ6YE32_9HYME|nr:PREDICTED: amphoterin-induced protein 3 [Ceratosolen solmsi marchali]